MPDRAPCRSLPAHWICFGRIIADFPAQFNCNSGGICAEECSFPPVGVGVPDDLSLRGRAAPAAIRLPVGATFAVARIKAPLPKGGCLDAKRTDWGICGALQPGHPGGRSTLFLIFFSLYDFYCTRDILTRELDCVELDSIRDHKYYIYIGYASKNYYSALKL